jgi:hypothetical protein
MQLQLLTQAPRWLNQEVGWPAGLLGIAGLVVRLADPDGHSLQEQLLLTG